MSATLRITAALTVGYAPPCHCGNCPPDMAISAVGLGVGFGMDDEAFFDIYVPDPNEPQATDEDFIHAEELTALWRGPCVCGVMVVAMAGEEANILHGSPTCELWDRSDAEEFLATLRRYKQMEMGYAPGNRSLH